MKTFLNIRILVPVLFVATLVIFFFANSASKVLDVHNPVKTVKESSIQKSITAIVMKDSVEIRAEENN